MGNSDANPTIDYNDVWNNGTNYDGCNPGPHDLNPPQDPKYGSYTLQSDSLCRDAIKSIPPSPPLEDPVGIDYLGYKRPKGDGYDMGTYEYVAPVATDYTLPGGTGEESDYRIFTVPLDVGSGSDMLDQMEAVLDSYDQTHWRVFAYEDASYPEINSGEFAALNIKPGMGFWIITLYESDIPFEGSPAPDGVDFELELPSGWHLIGLPWIDTDVALGDIKVTDGVYEYAITSDDNKLTRKCVWDYKDSYIKRDIATLTLQCGTGYFFKVGDNPVRLIIPYPGSTSSSPAEFTVPPESSRSLQTREEAPPPPSGPTPDPDIKANGQDGPVAIGHGDSVSVTVSLDAGNWADRHVDWWVAAKAPFGWYSYVYPKGWRKGIHVCTQTPLFPLDFPFEVLNMVLPSGDYTFYFAVDDNADGKIDETWVDSVGVTVE